MTMKKSRGIAILAAVLIILAGLAYSASIILSSTGKGENHNIKLGLDLAGGVSITYQVMDDNPTDEEMSDTVYKLQKRIESYSTEAQVYKQGDDRITVEIPGVTDANEILEELGTPGSLEFRDPDGNVCLTGDDVESKGSCPDKQDGLYGICCRLKVQRRGNQEVFGSYFRAHVGEVCPIVYDEQTISMPRVNEAITGGSAQISGMSSYEEAETLASNIRIGSLSLTLRNCSQRLSELGFGKLRAVCGALYGIQRGSLFDQGAIFVMFRRDVSGDARHYSGIAVCEQERRICFAEHDGVGLRCGYIYRHFGVPFFAVPFF